MEKKENSQLKSNVISGISSTAGAVAGVVGGSMVTAEANATEMPEATTEEQEVEVVSAEPSRTGGSQNHHEEQPVVQQSAPVSPEKPVSNDNTGNQGNTGETGNQEEQGNSENQNGQTENGATNNEVEVLSYETMTDGAGNEIDVAVVSANNQEYIYADVDQDGTADLIASDLNGNGQLEENEIEDISGENIAMQPFEEAANVNDNMLAQTDDLDYVNNADVNDYMA